MLLSGLLRGNKRTTITGFGGCRRFLIFLILFCPMMYDADGTKIGVPLFNLYRYGFVLMFPVTIPCLTALFLLFSLPFFALPPLSNSSEIYAQKDFVNGMNLQ